MKESKEKKSQLVGLKFEGGKPRKKIWVCGACGKTAAKRDGFRDVSCTVNAVLCWADTYKFEGNSVYAEAVPVNVKQSKN